MFPLVCWGSNWYPVFNLVFRSLSLSLSLVSYGEDHTYDIVQEKSTQPKMREFFLLINVIRNQRKKRNSVEISPLLYRNILFTIMFCSDISLNKPSKKMKVSCSFDGLCVWSYYGHLCVTLHVSLLYTVQNGAWQSSVNHAVGERKLPQRGIDKQKVIKWEIQ